MTVAIEANVSVETFRARFRGLIHNASKLDRETYLWCLRGWTIPRGWRRILGTPAITCLTCLVVDAPDEWKLLQWERDRGYLGTLA